jgi:glycine hydroxymethyltransferase
MIKARLLLRAFVFGVPAITTIGMKEEHMQTVVDLLGKVLMNIDDGATITSAANEVHEMMNGFLLYRSWVKH